MEGLSGSATSATQTTLRLFLEIHGAIFPAILGIDLLGIVARLL